MTIKKAGLPPFLLYKSKGRIPKFFSLKIRRSKLYFRDSLSFGLQVRLQTFLRRVLVCWKNEYCPFNSETRWIRGNLSLKSRNSFDRALPGPRKFQ
ncbi:hypothetical protein CH380_20855 [Leptospira adleri]|uniref:Uncharacterized protein n=1 Tax=Leptospira adleri TaxID=2023186 RepID=A0A2M9YIB3_9LEPT|nr:hypothetical protein CH380_20855 [Leptospira adleri]PJZ60211.1 hypothetical protein CH376_19605 [Leptospira adleri]